MMKSENVFKFVAIRSPEQTIKSNVRAIHNPNRDWLNRITTLASNNVSLHEARTRISRDFIDSARYVLRSPSWKPLLALKNRFNSLFANPTDQESLKLAINAILSDFAATSTTIDNFVASEKFLTLKNDLWDSYYSNLSLVNVRPSDRPILEFWIKVFHLLEQLAAEEDILNLGKNFDAWQLIVPNQLFQNFNAKEFKQDVIEAEVSQDITQQKSAIKSKIVHIQKARQDLTDTLHKKLNTITTEQQINTQIEGAGGSSENLPWVFNNAEISSETLATLQSLNISLAFNDFTQIEDVLERFQATAESELQEIESRSQVSFIRGIPVRRRRIKE